MADQFRREVASNTVGTLLAAALLALGGRLMSIPLGALPAGLIALAALPLALTFARKWWPGISAFTVHSIWIMTLVVYLAAASVALARRVVDPAGCRISVEALQALLQQAPSVIYRLPNEQVRRKERIKDCRSLDDSIDTSPEAIWAAKPPLAEAYGPDPIVGPWDNYIHQCVHWRLNLDHVTMRDDVLELTFHSKGWGAALVGAEVRRDDYPELTRGYFSGGGDMDVQGRIHAVTSDRIFLRDATVAPHRTTTTTNGAGG